MSAALSVYETPLQLSASGNNLPDTIEYATCSGHPLSNPNFCRIQSTHQSYPYLDSSGGAFTADCSANTGMLSMSSGSRTPCGAGGGYIFPNSNNICTLNNRGGDSSAQSSTSSSRTRLVGLGGSILNNDSGVSTLSSNNESGGSGGGSTLMIPSNILANTTPVHHNHPVGGGYTSPDICAKNGCGGGLLAAGSEEIDDLEAIPRDRCNTWPLRRPTLDINAQTSPLIHDRIPEEENAYDDDEEEDSNGGGVGADGRNLDESYDVMGGGGLCGGGRNALGSPSGFSNEMSPSDSALGGDLSHGGANSPPSSGKKSTTRRNAWGNMSYADLITQAILNSPEKRLTLSQVYEWMVQNVPYFRDKGDSNSSAGWKNSIRHNLSLHSRFMRIQNEGAGKSSWWVINPDAKPGRNPRRRAATMETATKTAIDKKRRGARKRVELGSIRGSTLHSAGTSMMSSQASVLSQDLYSNCDDGIGSGGGSGAQTNFDTFRPRTQSTLSIPGGSSRVSPTLEPPGFEDFDFPPWMDNLATGPSQSSHVVSEILDRTDQMRLESEGAASYRRTLGSASMLSGVKLEPSIQAQQVQSQIPQQTSMGIVKAECMDEGISQLQPPPSYQELNSVRGGTAQLQQNPLLRGQLQQSQPSMLAQHKISPSASGIQYYTGNGGGAMFNPTTIGVQQPQWAGSSLMQQQQSPQSFLAMNGAGGSLNYGSNTGMIPSDLESLSMPADQSLMELDMEAVLRHELSQTRDNQLHFDFS